ncbi:hypothetical protein CCP4SC76_1550009 [Gammaproteobacteria bacterium]
MIPSFPIDIPNIKISMETRGKIYDYEVVVGNERIEESCALRYSVYCGEYGFTSPYANHDKQIITDGLDETAVHFIARHNTKVVACLRLNASRFSDLGDLEQLYNMKSSPKHPHETSIGTKLIIAHEHRGFNIDLILLHLAIIAALKYMGTPHIFMDGRVGLTRFYEMLGLCKCGEKFFHYETGEAVPMMINLLNIDYLRSIRSPLAKDNCVMHMERFLNCDEYVI